ncbi:HMG box-containing protein C19G7.04 [Tolypocladium ophioglossoides CBS 100239]|uniref:HMG box-containing protein C19G7.04 n=1 Tax=Tolypocladium ophioglossoides (strain CBS 100239) TaxID=1163406 RepID=A0A0L0N9Q2_TOLOC|nr:HMG box-containing protein C19G7.04 [Tolypocladium ophioglossoides CBS 100239]
MARLVDCYPSSDDELPRLDVLLKMPNTGSARLSKDLVAESPERKDLVPKSSSTASTRKVRRLGARIQASVNPLFLPWNARDQDSPQASSRTSPRKSGRVSRQQDDRSQNHASQSEQDSAPPSVPTFRSRRRRAVPLLDDDSDGDPVEAGTTLKERIRELRGGRACVIPDVGILAVGDNDNAEDTQTRKLRHSEALEPKTEPRFTNEASEVDEPSVYQTAAEISSEYSDGSASEFELDHFSDGAFGEASVKNLLEISRHRGARSKAAREETFEALKPRNTNTKPREVVRVSKEKDSSSRASSRSEKATVGEDVLNAKTLSTASDLTDSFEKLRIHLEGFSSDETQPDKRSDFTVSPSTPPKNSHPRNLVSPRKLARIPRTPHHRPSVDAFWSQDFVDDWNDKHSPRKLILPPVIKSPAKPSPKKTTRKSFEAKKHSLAEEFLRELDTEITHGKIAELAKSTGGVKVVWTKTLNTTAGRANWRRETIRTQQADGTLVSVNHKHHASIELAEKVIDDENRLLNVLAHEFCHLANFMISGIKNNPHGKEFKAWAAKCSRAFGDSRGIQVTTKHTYEIDFKYVWTCMACGSEYKRHSKSIDPQRHRCGSCKSALKQTKPVPRGSGAGGGAGSKPSEYQIFVKEQMKVVRGENPGSPQKEVMRIVADKWVSNKKSTAAASKTEKKDEAGGVVTQMVDLTLDGGDEGE